MRLLYTFQGRISKGKKKYKDREKYNVSSIILSQNRGLLFFYHFHRTYPPLKPQHKPKKATGAFNPRITLKPALHLRRMKHRGT